MTRRDALAYYRATTWGARSWLEVRRQLRYQWTLDYIICAGGHVYMGHPW